MAILRFLILFFVALYLLRRVQRWLTGAVRSSPEIRTERPARPPEQNGLRDKTQQDISDADFKEIP